MDVAEKRVTAWVVTLVSLALAGCGGSTPPPPSHVATGSDQASRGQALYADKCADCHGDKGEGAGPVPALVGKSALPLNPAAGSSRKTPFHTAADVIAFVKTSMPPKKPNTLSDDEASAIVAFALSANGVDVSGRTIDPSSAAAITLHP